MMRQVLGLICLVGGVASTFLALYYFFQMIENVKPSKKSLLPFLGPTIFLLPLWEKEGKAARNRFGISVLLFIFFSVLWP